MVKTVYDWRNPVGKVAATTQADFERNREGIYGGLAQVRSDKNGKVEETATADFDRNREGIYGGLPKVRSDQ